MHQKNAPEVAFVAAKPAQDQLVRLCHGGMVKGVAAEFGCVPPARAAAVPPTHSAASSAPGGSEVSAPSRAAQGLQLPEGQVL
jgi:hypothetical protein